jgi:uncharacterized protein involved in high-affinity Fe2+ transport
MKFKKLTVIGASLAMMLALSFALTSCDWFKPKPETPVDPGTGTDEPETPGAGFTEYPLGDDVEFVAYGINVAGVYFEAVTMTPATGLSESQADAHMEADISALQGNRLGFGAGDFVPGLSVRYEVSNANGITSSGTFMLMNASDGPHYGGNVIFGAAKGQAGTYNIKFFISVDKSAYQMHTDPTTGVDGRLWDGELVAEWDFDFIPFSD